MTPTFEQIRDKFIELAEISVKASETRPERIQGCMNGLAICRRMTSIQDVESEILARTPELAALRDKAISVPMNERNQYMNDPNGYWAFRHADAQLAWFYAILEVAEQRPKVSARAVMFYSRILHEIEKEG